MRHPVVVVVVVVVVCFYKMKCASFFDILWLFIKQ